VIFNVYQLRHVQIWRVPFGGLELIDSIFTRLDQSSSCLTQSWIFHAVLGIERRVEGIIMPTRVPESLKTGVNVDIQRSDGENNTHS